MINLWHWTSHQGMSTLKIKLLGDRSTGGGSVFIVHLRQFSTGDVKLGVVWAFFIFSKRHPQVKGSSISSFHLFSYWEEGCVILSLCPLFGTQKKVRYPDQHTTCHVWLLDLKGDSSLNMSWRSHYWCNSALRGNSLAWFTGAGMWVKITWNPFNSWQESDVNKIIEFRAAHSQ